MEFESKFIEKKMYMKKNSECENLDSIYFFSFMIRKGTWLHMMGIESVRKKNITYISNLSDSNKEMKQKLKTIYNKKIHNIQRKVTLLVLKTRKKT